LLRELPSLFALLRPVENVVGERRRAECQPNS
jgi:hypothetical protein